MKSFAIAALLGATQATLMSSYDYEFIKYVAKHGKTYGTKEEFQFRSAIFQDTLIAIEKHNS